MDSDAEVERILKHGETDEVVRKRRPPSSYGSMRSDDEEDGSSSSLSLKAVFVPKHSVPGLQLLHATYQETLYTETTQQSKQPNACIIETRLFDDVDDDLHEEEIEEEDDGAELNSPEPPSLVDDEEQMQAGEPEGHLHQELCMPHVFKNILCVLSGLSPDDLTNFKIYLCRAANPLKMQDLFECDVLDLVDKMIEVLGYDNALRSSINCLESIKKITEAQELGNKCRRVLIHLQLKQHIIRMYEVIREGIPQAGKQNLLNTIYVEPQISTRPCGGINPDHELRPKQPTPAPIPAESSLDGVNNLLCLRKANGEPVKTVVTTGMPGIGMSVVAAKFSLDWAEDHANNDLQFVIPLSFHELWSLQKRLNFEKMSIMEVIEYFYQGFSDGQYLAESDCRFLIIMDSFDCYLATLDWKQTPVLTDIYTPANVDVLIVNLIRGNLLPAARIWILGRQAAVSNIPSEFIDAVTEIHGFSDDMKDEYLRKRFVDQELAADIVFHYKRTPTLRMLCHHPFLCWMAATTFEHSYGYVGYGEHPPRITPFYIHTVIIQTKRKLQRYYGQPDEVKWSQEDIDMLLRMGEMALKMVRKNTFLFSEEDLNEHGLALKETIVFSGLCTELPSPDTTERRKFSFIHVTVQEFMAAVYIFTMFHLKGRNVLEESRPQLFPKLSGFMESRSIVGLLRSGVRQTLNSPQGHLDMVLRLLCGLHCRDNHNDLLRLRLLSNAPAVKKLDEARIFLEREMEKAPADRLTNLKECLREMVQEDD